MTLFYYDGDKIEKYANFPNVSGFTMNSTFIKQSGYSSYRAFYNANSNFVALSILIYFKKNFIVFFLI